MARTINFYYDFLSPYSYLAATQLPKLAQRTGASIAYKPIDALELMQRVGNAPTTLLCESKGRYARLDLGRWAARYGVPFSPNPNLRSIDGRALLLGAVVASSLGETRAYNQAIFQGIWVHQAAFADDTETLAILERAGFDHGEAVLTGRDQASESLNSFISEAVQAGVFGAPSFKLEEELFFGNDRLAFLEEALAK